MKTVPITTEQLDHLLTVLDYVLTTEATSYEEWCDMGNNPEQHVWFYAADAVTALGGELQPKKYTVDVEMTYMQTIEVEAEGKVEAQAIAIDKFDILDAYYRRSRAIAYPQGEQP